MVMRISHLFSYKRHTLYYFSNNLVIPLSLEAYHIEQNKTKTNKTQKPKKVANVGETKSSVMTLQVGTHGIIKIWVLLKNVLLQCCKHVLFFLNHVKIYHSCT